MTKDIVLIGGGGHCHSCIDVIECQNYYAIKGILDLPDKLGNAVSGYRVIGSDDDAKKLISQGHYFLITLGATNDGKLRKRLFDYYSALGAKFVNIISPRAHISSNCQLGVGNIIMHDVIVNRNCKIGDNCIFNTKSLIEHDCIVGDHAHVATSATVNGHVQVENECFIGSGSVIVQGNIVEHKAFVRAGSLFNRKRSQVAVLTVAYEQPNQSVCDYFDSLEAQSFEDFDVLIVNDGFNLANKVRSDYDSLNIIELSPAESIPSNRTKLIKSACGRGYESVIFCDFDDYMSKNRVEESLTLLREYDVVVNDLNLEVNGTITEENYLSKRFFDGDLIDLSCVLDKNFLGFTNTALNLAKVKSNMCDFPENLVAVDWYFFTRLLINSFSCSFTNKCFTVYRQHEKNIIGLASKDQDSMQRSLDVKKKHYSALQKYSPEVFKPLSLLYEKTKLTDSYKTCVIETTPLWWENFTVENNNEVN